MKRWLIAGCLWVSLWGGLMAAADLQVQVTARPGSVSLGDPVELRIVVSGPDLQGMPPLQLPELNYFKQGKSTEETSYKPVSGALQITRTRIMYLTAVRAGTCKLKPITVIYKNKAYHSNSLTIEIKRPAAVGEDVATDLFVRSVVSSPKVSVGEPVHYCLKVYRQFAFKEKPTLRLPLFQGFFQTIVPVNSAIKKETINGKSYYVTEVVRRILYATEPGTISISDAAVSYRLNPPSSPMVTSEAPPVTVTVIPFPEPKPSDFVGAVGDFSVAIEAPHLSGTQYAPITVKVRVTGAGNLESVSDVIVPTSNSVKWSRGTASNLSVHEVVTARVIEYSVVPQVAGNLTLEPITLVVYSPKQRRYLTLSTGPLHLSVTPGDSATAALDKSIQFPIRPLRPFLVRSRPVPSGMGGLFWALVSLNIVMVTAGVVIRLRTGYIATHRGDFEWSVATDRCLKQLDLFYRDPLATGVATGAYHSVQLCFSAKLRQPVDGLDAAAFEAVLRRAGAEEPVIAAVLNWRRLGESLAFSPTIHDVSTIRDFIQRSIRLIEVIRWLGRPE